MAMATVEMDESLAKVLTTQFEVGPTVARMLIHDMSNHHHRPSDG